MSFLDFIKEGLKQTQLSSLFKPKQSLQTIQSQDKQLEQTLTFFNRIVQQVNIINLNKNITSISSQPFLDSDSFIKIYSYVPRATNSQINIIDPVFNIENIQPKLLQYQLESISLNKDNIKEHIIALQESQLIIEDQIVDILENNHNFIYQSFIQIQQAYFQLFQLSESINSYRNKIKSHLFQILGKYVRLKKKSQKVKILNEKIAFMQNFRSGIGIIFTENGMMFQRILTINKIINTLNNAPNMFKGIVSLKGLNQKCEQVIGSSEMLINKTIKSSILQKHIPDSVIDIILSTYLLYQLFRYQKYVLFFSCLSNQLTIIQQFLSNPSGSSNIKDYLEIAFKYLNNINIFKLFIKQTKTSFLKTKLILLQSNNIVDYFRQMRTQIDDKLNTFFKKVYDILGIVCKQVFENGKQDDKKVIKKFVQMIQKQHHSQGFKQFKTLIKSLTKK